MVDKNLLILFSILLMWVASSSSVAQKSSQDSLLFHDIRQKMDGCWQDKSSGFCYSSENNFGHESMRGIRSSAPFFILSIQNDVVCVEWIELTGGSTSLPVLKITERRLIYRGADGKKYSYKRIGNPKD